METESFPGGLPPRAGRLGKYCVGGGIHGRENTPFAKNPPIAKGFREIGLADELGSGMRNSYKYTKMYSGGEPTFTEGDVFTIMIPLSEAATATVGPPPRYPSRCPQDTPQVIYEDTKDRLNAVVEYYAEPGSKKEMILFLGLSDNIKNNELVH